MTGGIFVTNHSTSKAGISSPSSVIRPAGVLQVMGMSHGDTCSDFVAVVGDGAKAVSTSWIG